MRTLVSRRLTLRPIATEDIPFIVSLLGDEDRTAYLFGGTPVNRKQAEVFIEQYFTAEAAAVGMGVLTANHRERPVGFAGIIPTDCLGGQDFEFGFVLSREAERNDYAAEIGFVQMRYAFETLRLTRILALAHPQNDASVHVLRDKLQMTELAHIGQTAHRGARIIFCRGQAEGLPAIHGQGWSPLSSVSRDRRTNCRPNRERRRK